MKRLLRSILTAVVIVVAVQCFSIGVLASNLPRVVGRPTIQETRELTLPAAEQLVLRNEDGSVQVRTHDVHQIQVTASIIAYVRTPAERDLADTYVASLVQVEASDGLLRIVTEPADRPDSIDLRVDYDVRVPRGAHVTVEGSNGNVWISQGCGRVSVQGRNTDIEISEPTGPVFAQSTNGRIRVLDAPDGATLKTVNGSIYAHMLGGALQATTTNGAIVARVLDPRVEQCTLSSQNGGITLAMRDECSASITADTDRGVIRSDLTIETDPGCQTRRRLKGMVGEGHTKVSMDTLNGNIWITKDST